ncbi:MAG: hypothetical protein B6244_06160 [Candidatus Cloacimonetes bacterium 4572_55]|nr:MAG: hypothetical protein B6244_06160 [Candidatus Cloacimonetes bacterium 4572_55]
MNSPEIKAFIRENGGLFWSMQEAEKENIPESFLVETILNYGDEKEIRRLFELLGIERVADIFSQQISRKRKNYRPKTIHFFKLYFKKNAQRNPDQKTN